MLLRKTLQFLPAQLLGPLSQFASILIWTHLVSAETLGVATLVTGQQELIRTVLLAWWSQYTLRFIGGHEENDAGFHETSMRVVLISSLLQIILAYVLLVVFITRYPSPLLCGATCLFVVLRNLNLHNSNIAAARGHAFDYNVLSLCGPVLGLAIGCVLLYFLGDDPAYPLLGYAAGEGVAAVRTILKNHVSISFSGFNKNIFEEAIRFSAPILVSGIFAWSAANLSRYIIDHEMGLGAAGEFAVGFGLGQRAANLAAMLVAAAAFPLAVRRMQESGLAAALRQLSDNCALLLATMLPCLIGLHLVSENLIDLLISAEFRGSALNILPWALLCGGLYAFIYHYLNHYFLISAKTKPMILVDGSLALFTLVLSFPMIRIFGLAGGVIAMVISAILVIFVLFSWLLFKGLIFPWKHFFRIGISCVIMVVCVVYNPVLEGLMDNIMLDISAGFFSYAIAMLILYKDRVAIFLMKK